MNKHIFTFIIVIAILLTGVFAYAKETSLLESIAIISDYEGESKIKALDNKQWKNVSINMPVYEGAEFKTGNDSFIEVTFDDASIIRLDNNSNLKLSEMKREKNLSRTIFNLTVGKLFAIVDKLTNKEDTFEVHTKMAIAAVKGTEFAVGAGTYGSVAATFKGEIAFGALSTGNIIKLIKDKESGLGKQGGKPGKPGSINKLKDSKKHLEKMRKEIEKIRKLRKLGKKNVNDYREEKKKQKMKKKQGKKEPVDPDKKRKMKRKIRKAMRHLKKHSRHNMNIVNNVKKNDFRLGKSMIDVHGNRIRIEEHVFRGIIPEDVGDAGAPVYVDRGVLSLLSITLREKRIDYFRIDNVFNTYLPDKIPASAWAKTWINRPDIYQITKKTTYSNTRDKVEFLREYWLDPPSNDMEGPFYAEPENHVHHYLTNNTNWELSKSLEDIAINGQQFEHSFADEAMQLIAGNWTQDSNINYTQSALDPNTDKLTWYSTRFNTQSNANLTIKLYLIDDLGTIQSSPKSNDDWSDLLANTNVEMRLESNLFTNPDKSIDVVSKVLWWSAINPKTQEAPAID